MAGDAAVFEIEEGRYPWQDMDGHEFETEQRLAPQLTVLGGEVVWEASQQG